MDFSNLREALILLVVGLGVVYGFLCMLVIVMKISGKIIPRFSFIIPDAEPKKVVRPAAAASDDAAIALAIAVARAR